MAFGPKPRDYTVKVNRKARRRALRAALSMHAERGTLAVVDPGDFDAPSTKKAAEGLAKLAGEGSVLLVLSREGEESGASSASATSAHVNVLPADQVGVADIVGAARLVVSQSALDQLTQAASTERAQGEEAAA